MSTEVTDLTRKDYELIRRLVYAKSGINLGDDKVQLVRTRLGKRVRQGGFSSYRDYCKLVEADTTGEELCKLLDAISTNTTHLFREIQHFEFLKAAIGRWIADRRWQGRRHELRIWSAGCSSGEEPHSIAMTAAHALSGQSAVSLKILATDLSTQMLAKAARGLYESHRIGTVPPALAKSYLTKVMHDGQLHLEVNADVKRAITFARFNLMDATFPFKQGFDVIFCRNVMIYFDKPTQERLVCKFAKHLLPGGYLMIGHSESLNGLDHPLTYVQPTTYKRE